MHSPGRSVALLLLAMPLPAVAAPFCVESESLPPQCIYFDAASCGKRAAQLGATCSVNGNEVHVSAAIGHYCLLTSSLVSSCIYVPPRCLVWVATASRGADLVFLGSAESRFSAPA